VSCHDAATAVASAPGRQALTQVLEVLAERGVERPWAEAAATSPREALLARFERFLLQERAVASSTGSVYVERGFRTFTVPHWIMSMLAKHLTARGITGADNDALVFVSPDGEPLHYSNWRRCVWQPAVAAAGFTDLHFHDVRHTAATALVDEGVDIKTAQTRLGHSEQVMLRIYAQATPRADLAAAEKIGRRFQPAGWTRDGIEIEGGEEATGDASDPPDQALRRGRCGTRTHDLSRVKANPPPS
jgi:hypothetical protein